MKKFVNLGILFTFYGYSYLLAAAESPVILTIYEDSNYSGESLEIRGDRISLGDMNNKMSSFKITSGYQVRFFHEENFKGGHYSRSSNAKDSAYVKDYDNSISSVQILKYPDHVPVAVTLYDGKDFIGDIVEIKGDIASIGNMNKRMSSFRVASGYQVRFFREEFYKGGYYTRESNATDEAFASGFDNAISSVKILKYGEGDEIKNQLGELNPERIIPLTIYDHANFEGKMLELEESVSDLGDMDNKMASYKFGSGYRGIFFQNNSYAGAYTFKNDASSDQVFVEEAFLDNVSSIYIERKHGVILFTGKNYTGESRVMHENSWNYTKPVGSYYVRPGSYVVFYNGKRYLGGKWTRTKSSSDAEAEGIKNVRSIAVATKASEGSVAARIYPYSDYNSGEGERITGDIADIDFMDSNKISLRVNPGFLLALYPNKNWMPTKAPTMVTRNYMNMPKQGSVKVFEDPRPEFITLYTDQHFRGTKYRVTENMPDLNDAVHNIQSYKIENCYVVQFYEKVDYKGEVWTRPDPDQGFLNQFETESPYFAKLASSLKVIKRPHPGYDGGSCVYEQ